MSDESDTPTTPSSNNSEDDAQVVPLLEEEEEVIDPLPRNVKRKRDDDDNVKVDLTQDDENVEENDNTAPIAPPEAKRPKTAEVPTFILDKKVETLVIRFEGNLPKNHTVQIHVQGQLHNLKVEPPKSSQVPQSAIKKFGSMVSRILGVGGSSSMISIGSQNAQIITNSHGGITITNTGNGSSESFAAIKLVTGDVGGSVENLSGDIQCGSVKNGASSTSGNIVVKGSVAGSVTSTSGDIQCGGNIDQSVRSTSGDVTCKGNIGGSASTVSGDIRAKSIGGKASSVSGSVKH
jgi:hypothetical protein